MTTLSLDKTLTAVIAAIRKYAPDVSGRHLDIGSGTGELIRQVQAEFDVQSHACDYTDEFMQIDGQHVDIVDLNRDGLPYEDAFFDLITFTEVVEHLEHYRLILREAQRVLKPGGLLIVTTPNILNLKSRIRFLFTGFWNLFGPLHVGETAIESAGGHISPISWFYLAHALMDAGFEHIRCDYDKYQRSSLLWLVLLYLPIRIFGAYAFHIEKTKYRTIDKHNAELVRPINSIGMLLGRTLVVSAGRPSA
ncbi:MAG: class I SAM-dependent methyltransferase [Mariprofundaceae bacterium]|nr:class I SAM-dependent methyltransferase [Mariprofundaceae bacterium]